MAVCTSRPAMTLIAVAAMAFVSTACQQGAGNSQGTSGNAAQTGATSNAAAAAPANAAAPAAPSDPGSATGPVTLASDTSLPAPCQDYVRQVQACIDNLPGEAAEKAHHEWTLRTQLHSRRGTWALAQDDSYRARLCEGDVTSFPQERARLRCTAR